MLETFLQGLFVLDDTLNNLDAQQGIGLVGNSHNLEVWSGCSLVMFSLKCYDCSII